MIAARARIATCGRLGRGSSWLVAMAGGRGRCPEPVGPGGGGEDHTGPREQGAAGGAEVVAVVVVTDQHGVTWAEVGGVIAGPINFRPLEPQPKR